MLSPPTGPEAALCYQLEPTAGRLGGTRRAPSASTWIARITCLRRLQEWGERDSWSAWRLGVLLAERGDLDESVADLGQAINLLSHLPATIDENGDEGDRSCHHLLVVAIARRAELLAQA